MMAKVISHGISLVSGGLEVELQEFRPLNETIIVLVIGFEKIANAVIAECGLFSSATVDELSTSLFCHFVIIVGVHVKPLIEDFGCLLCKLSLRCHQRSMRDVLN